MMGRISFLFVIVLLQVFHASLCVHAKELESLGFIRCKKHELDALLKFKQSFTRDPMNRLSSWVGEDCCEWHGVTCDNVTHHVVKLNLRSQLPHYYNDDFNAGYHIRCLPDPQVSMVSPGVSSALLELKLLTHLDLSGNNFSESQIPEFIGSLRQLRFHRTFNPDRAHGHLFELPPRNQTQIGHLDLSDTGISGELPGWLWNSSYLQYIQLSGNRLTGSLPQHIACDGHYHSCNLKRMDLHNNLLTGTIPKWLRNLETLQLIDLSSNLLSGPIFDGNNSSLFFHIGNPLVVLDVSDNLLSGEIQFGNVHPNNNLEILSLRGNHFTGPIRSQFCGLKSLLILELAQNRLTGHIPRCLGSIRFNYTLLRGGVLEVQTIEIVKGIVEVSTETGGGQSIIDLSSNYLVGTIPEELTNISALFALNLSYNHLTGHIPENIGNLKTVESLDLSNNHLSGTIPQSLSSISWISKLNLSNNNLHGPIPTGSQLQTLDDPSIYAGNSGLCGFPLPNNCTKPDPPPSLTNVNPTDGKYDVEKKDKYENLWFILAVMFGVATGFWGVVGTLVINKSWRQAYFQYVKDLGDRIYVPIKLMVSCFKRRFNKNA